MDLGPRLDLLFVVAMSLPSCGRYLCTLRACIAACRQEEKHNHHQATRVCSNVISRKGDFSIKVFVIAA